MPETEPLCAKIALSTLLAVEQDAPEEIHPDSQSVAVVTEGLPKREINGPNGREVEFGCAAGGLVCEFSFSVREGQRLTRPAATELTVCVEDLELAAKLDCLMEATFGEERTKELRDEADRRARGKDDPSSDL